MPYIDPNYRKQYDSFIDKLANALSKNGTVPGDINYTVFRLMKKLWNKNTRYMQWAYILSGVQDSIWEFRRRYIGPYEDKAIERNGDVE